jgi:hypothetical protein
MLETEKVPEMGLIGEFEGRSVGLIGLGLSLYEVDPCC